MTALTRQQLLLIQEMCIDGEQRCDQRAADARARHDYHSAAFELQVRERYAYLKMQMMEELTGPTITSTEALGDLREVARFPGGKDPAESPEQEPAPAL